MTTTKPDRLNPPSLATYVFINTLFGKYRVYDIAHYPIEPKRLYQKDQRFGIDYFGAQHVVKDEQIAPLKAMSDNTLDRLLWILKPCHHSDTMTSKAIFDRVMAEQYTRTVGVTRPIPSYEQSEIYNFHYATNAKAIHWGQLADLYNESAPDQQEAIHQFFEKCLCRNLSDLFAIPASTLHVPESRHEQFDSKIEDGETYLFSKAEQQWLREDIFNQVFNVEIRFKGSLEAALLIGAAPTLSQAIALSTLYIQGSDLKNAGGNTVEISQLKKPLAIADVTPVINRKLHESGGKADSLKLIWDLDLSEFDAYISQTREMLDENYFEEDDHRRLTRELEVYTQENKHTFIKKLMAVEKALGIQWNKVQMLEDALGL